MFFAIKKFVVCLGLLFLIVTPPSLSLDFNSDIGNAEYETKSGRKLMFNPESNIIRNDRIWEDNEGDPLKAHRCGTISSKVNGYWYMVGSESHAEWAEGGNIYLYKSKALGSSSWEKVQKIDKAAPSISSCNINQSSVNTFVIHCRKTVYISYNGIEGNYEALDPLNINKKEDGRGKLKIGSTSIFRDVDDFYFVTSRIQKVNRDDPNKYRNRYMYIYKLNSTLTGMDEDTPPISWHWQYNESPDIAKKDGMYYMLASQTVGWSQSSTYFRRANTLQGLATAQDEQVVMHPADSQTIKSMGSQFCFLQEFDDGKWIFGGRRHPVEAPEEFATDYGHYVMTPLKFINGVPHVFWKYTFDWTKYNYNVPNHDEHLDFGHGKKPVPCQNHQGSFPIGPRGKKKTCKWASKKWFRRCRNFRELTVLCPVTCKKFGCGD